MVLRTMATSTMILATVGSYPVGSHRLCMAGGTYGPMEPSDLRIAVMFPLAPSLVVMVGILVE